MKARKLGLWNLFLSKAHYPEHGVPLSNIEVRLTSCCGSSMSTELQYAVMAEVLGRGGHVASEVVNCSAPDTGNMGVSCTRAFLWCKFELLWQRCLLGMVRLTNNKSG